jgi:hypothetical protein
MKGVHTMFKNIIACLILVVCVATNAYAQGQPTTSKGSSAAAIDNKTGVEKKKADVTVSKLKLSADGKAIVDEQGNEIAKFKEGMQVKTTGKSKTLKVEPLSLPGCMCCTRECLAYDNKGKCVKWYRSCTWDFDCNCK